MSAPTTGRRSSPSTSQDGTYIARARDCLDCEFCDPSAVVTVFDPGWLGGDELAP